MLNGVILLNSLLCNASLWYTEIYNFETSLGICNDVTTLLSHDRHCNVSQKIYPPPPKNFLLDNFKLKLSKKNATAETV